jgi:hypothetical protein
LRSLVLGALPALLLSSPLGCRKIDTTTDPGDDATPPPILQSFVTTKASITHGEWIRLVWKASGATSALLSPGVGAVSPVANGSIPLRPYTSTTYRIIVSNSAGADTGSVSVEVTYPGSIFVNHSTGDDARTGRAPDEALATLDAALNLATDGMTIHLSGGSISEDNGSPIGAPAIYESALHLDGRRISVIGDLSPDHFFEEPTYRETWILPPSGPALSVTDAPGAVVFRNLLLDVSVSGGEVAARIDGSTAYLHGCRILGESASTGTGLEILGASEVTLTSSVIIGGRNAGGGAATDSTCGVSTSDQSSVLVQNCFIDAGVGLHFASGIEARGNLRIACNTIAARVASTSGYDNSASIRIFSGAPSIGGNIFFSQGSGKRYGILETGPDTNPSWIEGNLFLAIQPLYGDWEGGDRVDQTEINSWPLLNGLSGTVGDNLHAPTAPTSSMFVSISGTDYHLKPTLPGGDPNPAIDAGGVYLVADRYGGVRDDIDGESRPSSGYLYDLGADEYR